jgi:DNA-binding MarR family transcriptional regulator
LIDRLVLEKLVSRAPSPQDRRRVFVQLTRHGDNVLEKLSSAHNSQLKRIGPELTRLLQNLAALDQ